MEHRTLICEPRNIDRMSLDIPGRDINPRAEATAAITRAQVELERALEEIDHLPAVNLHSVALAAHALNNFLTVSRGVVDLLIPVLHGHPDAQVGVWLQGLAHSTDLMSHTVSQLMNNAAGIETPLRREEFDLSRLVERACTYYRRGAAHKGLELHFRGEAGGLRVETDRVMVAAILDNLLSNAVKYSPRGKRIVVTVEPYGHGVVCLVTDEGPGLSPADRDRLFQPGVRLAPVPTGGEASTGYGLAVAKRFADQLGGTLTCESTPGRGTTFSFWLPRTNP
jgi:signal transduction histidine kinase